MKKILKKITTWMFAKSSKKPSFDTNGIYLMYTTYAERGWRHTRL